MNDPKARDRPDIQVLTEIGIIDQLAMARLERALPSNLSAAGFGLLTHFARRGGEQTPAELASAFQVTKGAMTNTIQRLEAEGYIAVRRDSVDGRKKQVSMTARGLQAQEQALDHLRPQTNALREAIPIAEFEAALPFLRRLRTWLDSNR